MTIERAREVARIILDTTRTHQGLPGLEALILAYRAEVRREALGQARANILEELVVGEYASGSYWNRALRLASDMIDALMIGEPPPERQPSGIGPTPERIQNVDRILRQGRAENATPAPPLREADYDIVLRGLAHAHAGDDYTKAGREFRDAVERLWPR